MCMLLAMCLDWVSPGPEDTFQLWRNRILTRRGQAFYLRLKLVTATHEVLVVPKHLSPKCPSLFPADYGAQRLIASAQEWIRQCESTHNSCEGPARRHQIKLKMIDCIARELRELPTSEPYVCLSYVWGIRGHQYGTDTLDLQNPPKTMEDSMYMTANLGMRYLWIDRYCIDQTNEVEKHDAISNMDVIYQGAALTIIAAAGSGPSYGLAGVRGTPRTEPQELFMEASSQTVFLNPRLEILKSTWSSRGWTYQEALLSRRCLVFSNCQLYFQCKSMHCGEYFTSDIAESTESSGSLRAFPQLQTAFADEYIFERLREYYSRSFSYNTDLIKAFLGVLKDFHTSRRGRTLRASQLYGVPLLYLDEDTPGTTYAVPNEPSMPKFTFATGLAWYISGTELWQPKATEANDYPTWSWASVKAGRGDEDLGELVLTMRSHQETASYGQDPHIHIYHREEGRKELAGHTDHWSDYELFHPYIDVESWAIEAVLLPEPGIGPRSPPRDYRLSGFKGGSLLFDHGPLNQTSTSVVVVLLGSFHMYIDPGVACFLVLVEGSDDSFRRVALYQSVEHDRTTDLDTLFGLITPHSTVEHGPPAALGVKAMWQRRALRLT